MKASLGAIFAASKTASRPEIREHGRERHVQPALDEEERRQEREGDHTQPLLLLAMLRVVVAHHEAKNESRKHGVSVRCRSANTMSSKRQANTSLISGSITRSP